MTIEPPLLCPPLELLAEWLDDRADLTLVDQIAQHVERCERCQSQLEQLTDFGHILDSLPDLIPLPSHESARFGVLEQGDSEQGMAEQRQADQCDELNRLAASRHQPTAGLPPAEPKHFPEIAGFEILSELGRGGYGIVYRARQLGLNREVALKVLRQGAFATPGERRRFAAEAESVGKLNHPHIVQVYSVGELAGLPYFVMELIRGGSLERQLNGTPWAARRAAEFVLILADTIEFTHQQGIVHRDLRPSNILMNAERSPKISDFGIAKHEGTERDETASQVILGSPSYMAPEQAAGRSKHVTATADIFSLGTILYELLIGRPPFRGETPFETLMMVRENEPIAPAAINPRVPRDLETICLRCLEKSPDCRYATAKALSEDLRCFLSNRPIQARRATRTERLIKWARRSPYQALMCGGVLIGLAIGAAGLLFHRSQLRSVRIDALIDRLLTADASRADELIDEVRREGADVQVRLRQRVTTLKDRKERLHAHAALVETDAKFISPLLDEIPTSSPADVILIRDGVMSYKSRVLPELWERCETSPDSTTKAQASAQRLRYFGVLAALAPEDPRWVAHARPLIAALLAENIFLVRDWAVVFQPIRSHLIASLIEQARQSAPGESEEDIAVALLLAFQTDTRQLAELLLTVSPRACEQILVAVQDRSDQVLNVLDAELAKDLSKVEKDEDKNQLAERQAQAAILAFRLKASHPALWKILAEEGPDRRVRHFAIHLLQDLGIPLQALANRLARQENRSLSRALLLTLGEYDPPQDQQREEWRERIGTVYQQDPDAGIHSAAEWLMKRWKLDDQLAQWETDLPRKDAPGRSWYATPSGFTMVKFRGPVQFMAGSAEDLPRINDFGAAHQVTINHSFAVATKEVTVAQFRQFLQARPDVQILHQTDAYHPEEEEPVRGVNWWQAIQYCRWLSEVEHVPEDQMVYAEHEKLRPDAGPYQPRSTILSGYRLTTVDEWEYACRAGTSTDRFYGSSPELLGHYAHYLLNSKDRTWPVGILRPNDAGLFDVYGNVWEITHDSYLVEPTTDENERSSIARGGSFLYHGSFIHSWNIYGLLASRADSTVGFRIARTIDFPAQ